MKKPRLSGASTSMLRTLAEHKRACQMRRLAMIQPVTRLARVFRAMIGDPEAQGDVTVGEVSMYEHGPTFEEFLRVNRLSVFEEVLR